MEVIFWSLILGISSTFTDVTVTGPEETTLWAARAQIEDISKHFALAFRRLPFEFYKINGPQQRRCQQFDTRQFLDGATNISGIIVVYFWRQPSVKASFWVKYEHIKTCEQAEQKRKCELILCENFPEEEVGLLLHKRGTQYTYGIYIRGMWLWFGAIHTT